MLVKNVTKGSYVQFTSTFYDANNVLITPESPVLKIYYRSNNEYLTITSNLVFSGNVWVGSWDSSNADTGIVQWYISSGGEKGIAEEGEFRVYGNHASDSTNPI